MDEVSLGTILADRIELESRIAGCRAMEEYLQKHIDAEIPVARQPLVSRLRWVVQRRRDYQELVWRKS